MIKERKTNNRKTGQEKEQIAAEFLQKKGYRIIQRNYRCSQGEIDLIMQNEKSLVFVEVKYRRNGAMGRPEEAVTLQKQRKICRCALVYFAEHGMPSGDIRFDVVAILGDHITHFEHAFDFQE